MDDRTHQHGAHSHGGRLHAHATVDHLASDTGQSARLAIRLDAALMATLGVAADAIVRLATDRGRSMLVRLDPPIGGRPRQRHRTARSLRAAGAQGAPQRNRSTSSRPTSSRSSASSSTPRSTSRWRTTSCRTSRRCCARRARRSAIGAVLYVPFPKSHAGTTYEVQHVTDGPGVVDDTTEIVAPVSRCARAGRRVRRHLRGRRRPEQADQADPRTGAASALAPAGLPPSRHQSAARHHPLRPARRRQIASGARGRQRGRRALLLHQRPRRDRHLYRRDRSQPAPHVQRGRPSRAVDHLHRRARRHGAQARRDRRPCRHPHGDTAARRSWTG